MDNDNPYIEWQRKPTRMLIKYFNDGTIEEWLSDDDNNELYLIRSKKHPSGKSPIVKINPIDEAYYGQ